MKKFFWPTVEQIEEHKQWKAKPIMEQFLDLVAMLGEEYDKYNDRNISKEKYIDEGLPSLGFSKKNYPVSLSELLFKGPNLVHKNISEYKDQRVVSIETFYRGYRFRSRLEARWAVYFDSIGIGWEYEKEGYDLGNGKWYLPDFWLPQVNIWAEVKPVTLSEEELDMVFSLVVGTNFECLLLVGIPDYIQYKMVCCNLSTYNIFLTNYKNIISTGHRFYIGEKIEPSHFSDVTRAVARSRQARFEYGECV